VSVGDSGGGSLQHKVDKVNKVRHVDFPCRSFPNASLYKSQNRKEKSQSHAGETAEMFSPCHETVLCEVNRVLSIGCDTTPVNKMPPRGAVRAFD
jgi:hypothetical protein